MLRRVATVFGAFALATSIGCSSDKPEPPKEIAAPPPIKQAEEDAADAAAEEEVEAADDALGGQAYITVVAAMRKAASGDRRIEDPDNPGKKISNWVATLHAGESVDVVGGEGEWAQVKASDDSEGWIKKKYLVSSDEASLVTLLEEAQVFRRPDLLALNASKTLEPASLMFKLKEKEQFSEVQNGYSTQWVLTEKLNMDDREVEAAKLVAKARWLEKQKDESYGPLMDLIKSQFADTKTVGVLAAKEAEAENTAAEAEEADAEDQDSKEEEAP